MPIEGLSQRRRLPRMLKIRLGEKKTNARGVEYPSETDFFVIRQVDGATEEILKLYGGKPKSLRMMIPFEVEAVDPQTGDELVLNLSNRAYGSNAGLKCRGTGLNTEFPGVAEATDEAWAKRIAVAAGDKEPRKLPNGRFQIRCLGQDCPKYHLTGGEKSELVEGHDKDAACKAVIILRAFLLHPTTDSKNEDYCRVLGVAEVASSSRNAMIDIQSGLHMLRPFTGGRTSAIPFSLVRRPTYTFKGGKKLHFPCSVTFDPREVQQFGLTPPSQVFLSPESRATLQALRTADVDFDSVKDLLPARIHPRALPAASVSDPEPNGDVQETPKVTSDRDETVADAEDEANNPELLRTITQAERDELKMLCGKDPDDPASGEAALAKIRELAKAAHEHFNTAAEAGTAVLGSLQVRHARYIKELLAREAVTA